MQLASGCPGEAASSLDSPARLGFPLPADSILARELPEVPFLSGVRKSCRFGQKKGPLCSVSSCSAQDVNAVLQR